MLLRARIVLPISQPPIADGAVLISGNKISAIGPWAELKSFEATEIFDLGESILLPGLVNAHCHLDYTDMAGMIPPTRFFTDWIKSLLALKSNWSYSEYAKSWSNGAQMLLRTGTTTVADIEAVPELLPEIWAATPLRIFSFLEMTSVKSRRPAAEILQEVESKIETSTNPRGRIGLSPHALYSTTPELLKLAAQESRQKNWRLTMHVAESIQEFEMFAHQRGALFDWLKNQRDMSDCGNGSPIQQLEKLEMLSEMFLAIHVNYLTKGDAEILSRKKCASFIVPEATVIFGTRIFHTKN
ncbi:MAG: amidohydrolase family protein [Limisphaerales bacterium]